MDIVSLSSLILLFSTAFYEAKTDAVDFADPIREVLLLLNAPLRVHFMCCWNINERLHFFRALQLKHSTKEQNSNEEGKFYNQRSFQLAISDIDKFPKAIEEHQQIIVIDLNCKETSSLLHQSGTKISQNYRWIIFNDESNFDEDEKLLKTFQDLPVLPNSEVILLRKKQNHTNKFKFQQIYRTSLTSTLILEPFGVYENNKFYDKRGDPVTVRRRRNLNGAQLRASLVLTNNDSINHLTDGQDKQVDTISKVNYVLSLHLGEFVNANITFSIVNSWGYRDPETKQWNGMIGDLVDNRSDIGASALFFTPDRVHVIDYIAMPTPTRSKFVFRSPKLSYTENVFLLPFDTFVWISIVALIFITSLAMLISNWLEWKFKNSVTDSNLQKLQPSPLDSLILVFGATCQQGSSLTPRSMAGRIIMFLAFLILMFLYTSYSANIVALLQSPSRKIQTLNDLLNSRLKLGVDDTVFNRYYFTHATDPIQQKIYQEKIVNKDKSTNFMSLFEGVRRLRDGLFAFHMEIGVGYKIVSETFLEDEKCGLQEIQYLQVIDPWYAVRKNSSYKNILKIGLMRIHEHGLQERENSRLYTKKPKCNSGGAGKFITASLIDIRPAILTLLWGYFFAIIAVVIEILIQKNKIF